MTEGRNLLSMRAIAINAWGGRDQLELTDVPPPPVSPDGVLAALRAGGRLTSIIAPVEKDGYETHYVFVRPSGAQLRELTGLVEAGMLSPHVEEVFPLDRAADAHERIEAGHVRGKLVLSVP